MVRQSLALSVSLLAFVYLFNGEKKKAVGFYILTLLLHGSAIVGLCVPILYFVMTSYKLSKKQIGLIVVISILSILQCNFPPSSGMKPSGLMPT